MHEPQLVAIDVKPGAALESQSGLQLLRAPAYTVRCSAPTAPRRLPPS